MKDCIPGVKIQGIHEQKPPAPLVCGFGVTGSLCLLGAGEAGAQDGFGSTGESGVLFPQVPALFAVDLGGLWGCSWAREPVPVQLPGWTCQKLCGPGKGV